MYDIIGDIHGYATQLEAVLEKLGYRRRDGVYSHPERKVIFVGDFIDRGDKIKRVLEIVRPMIDTGAALAVMGNHEFNAICFHTEHPERPGEYLRCQKTEKNVNQHSATLAQLGEEILEYVEWFKTLPLYLDLPELRVVHACWQPSQIEFIRKNFSSPLTLTDLLAASDRESGHYAAIEDVLKGKEIPLPEGQTFLDKDGHSRTRIRVRWFDSLNGKTYRDAVLPSYDGVPEIVVEPDVIRSIETYGESEKPVFFGHYWLKDKQTSLLRHNVCCLDYSVAKEGFLAAYRFDGEKSLSAEKFVRV